MFQLQIDFTFWLSIICWSPIAYLSGCSRWASLLPCCNSRGLDLECLMRLILLGLNWKAACLTVLRSCPSSLPMLGRCVVFAFLGGLLSLGTAICDGFAVPVMPTGFTREWLFHHIDLSPLEPSTKSRVLQFVRWVQPHVLLRRFALPSGHC